MRDHEDALREAGANVAAIGLGDRPYAKAFRDETGIRFPLLVDESRVAYRAAGLAQASIVHLVRGDNFRARRAARAGGFRQHRLGPNPFQLGGSFVFGPGNVDHVAHVSRTFGDTLPVSALLAAVRRGPGGASPR